jgi:hypothetical protein
MITNIPAHVVAGLRRASRALFAVALVLVFVGSVLKISLGPDFRFSDKVGHAVVFFLLAALAQAGYARRDIVARLMLALLGYGLFIELVQALLPWRECSLWDWAADGVGIALCVALAHWLRQRFVAGRPVGP